MRMRSMMCGRVLQGFSVYRFCTYVCISMYNIFFECDLFSASFLASFSPPKSGHEKVKPDSAASLFRALFSSMKAAPKSEPWSGFRGHAMRVEVSDLVSSDWRMKLKSKLDYTVENSLDT